MKQYNPKSSQCDASVALEYEEKQNKHLKPISLRTIMFIIWWKNKDGRTLNGFY